MKNSNKVNNILVSINSFKGCLSALEANFIVKNAIKDFANQLNDVPLVDGGTGSIEAWAHLLNKPYHIVDTVDSIGKSITAPILVVGNTAYIEMAQASGIHLVDNSSIDILSKNTYGTGLLIKEALNLGCKKIYLGLGGSATHDLGTGILQALGVKFFDSENKELFTPRELLKTKYIDTTELLASAKEASFTLLCDVNNKLTGKFGAANVFAPQKGATTPNLISDCELLSNVFREIFKKKGIEMGNNSGDGAAGGIPALLRLILSANVESGVDFTLSLVNLKSEISTYDLIITGEGQFDEQSFYGKGPGTIVELAKKYHIPVIILTGGYKNLKSEYANVSLFSIVPYPTTLQDSMAFAKEWLGQAARNAVKLFVNGYNIRVNGE